MDHPDPRWAAVGPLTIMDNHGPSGLFWALMPGLVLSLLFLSMQTTVGPLSLWLWHLWIKLDTGAKVTASGPLELSGNIQKAFPVAAANRKCLPDLSRWSSKAQEGCVQLLEPQEDASGHIREVLEALPWIQLCTGISIQERVWKWIFYRYWDILQIYCATIYGQLPWRMVYGRAKNPIQ